MPPTSFPAGKTIKELGIDTTRKFVVVSGDAWRGEIVTMVKGSADQDCAWWESSNGVRIVSPISFLAYYEPTEPEAWEPKVYDIVGVNLEVLRVEGKRVLARVPGALELEYRMWLNQDTITLISRPPAPRKVTMEEVEQAMGGPVEIVD